MNRRGFLLSCAAAMVAPSLPVSGLGEVATCGRKWMNVDHLTDPDAPITLELGERFKLQVELGEIIDDEERKEIIYGS